MRYLADLFMNKLKTKFNNLFLENDFKYKKTSQLLLKTYPGWVPKALLNFQQIVGVEEYFLQLRELEWFWGVSFLK